MYFIKKEKYYHFLIEEENKEKAIERAFKDEFYLLRNKDKYTKYTKYRRDCIIIEILSDNLEYYNIGILYKGSNEINKVYALYKKINNISEVFEIVRRDIENARNTKIQEKSKTKKTRKKRP